MQILRWLFENKSGKAWADVFKHFGGWRKGKNLENSNGRRFSRKTKVHRFGPHFFYQDHTQKAFRKTFRILPPRRDPAYRRHSLLIFDVIRSFFIKKSKLVLIVLFVYASNFGAGRTYPYSVRSSAPHRLQLSRKILGQHHGLPGSTPSNHPRAGNNILSWRRPGSNFCIVRRLW